MKRAWTCVAWLGLLVLVGCSAADPTALATGKLVGSWKAEIRVAEIAVEGRTEPPDEEMMTMNVTFQDDGTLSMTMPFDEDAIAGTWEVTAAEEGKTTIKTVMQMPTHNFTEEDGEVHSETTYKEQAADFSIVFESDDRITMTPTDDPSDPITLDRQ